MRRLLLIALVLAVGLGAPAAGEIVFQPGFTPADLADLSEALGDALVLPNLGPAEPTGLGGFEILAAWGGPRVDSSSHWWKYGVNGSRTLGLLGGGRVIARKGLPRGFDVGGQVGTVLGNRFWGAEVRWALLEGGMVEPAVALRASFTRMEQSSDLRVDVSEVQLVASKGFTLLTPYAAAGYRRVESRAFFGDPLPLTWKTKSDRWTGAAGVRASFLPVRVVAEVRRSLATSVFVGVGVGL